MHNFSIVDKVQGKFLKFSLGVSKFASTSAVLRELGQFPVTLKGIRMALMYYYRLHVGYRTPGLLATDIHIQKIIFLTINLPE